MSSTETFLVCLFHFLGGAIPCWEHVGMQFFQPVQRRNSFVYLELVPATPSIKEVNRAVANYENTAAQRLFSHFPPQTILNATWWIGWQRQRKTERQNQKKKRNEACFQWMWARLYYNSTTNEETEDTFRRSKAGFKADSLFLRYESGKCPSIRVNKRLFLQTAGGLL